MISFKKITDINRQEILELKLYPDQENFIESIEESLEEASLDSTWNPLGIYENGKPIGFAMYGYFEEDDEAWFDRLLIDRNYQNKGFGREAFIRVVKEMFLKFPVDKIYLSVYKEDEVAIKLYKSLGAKTTGSLDEHGEIIMTIRKDEFDL